MVEPNESLQNPTPGATSASQEKRGGAIGRMVRGVFKTLFLAPIMAIVFLVAFLLALVFLFRRSSAPDAEAPSVDPESAGTEMLKRWWRERKAERH